MKLKNFIEVNVDENVYTKNEETGQLEIVQKIPSKKAFFNIEKISCFGDNRIFFKKLNRPVAVIESAEQIQQKIFECQKPNYYIVNNSKTISSDSVNFIPGKDNSSEKEFKDYINK